MKKILFLIISFFAFSAHAQNSTIEINNVPLSQVAHTVSALTSVSFSFGQQIADRKVSLFVPLPKNSEDILQGFFKAIESDSLSIVPFGKNQFQIVDLQSDKDHNTNLFKVIPFPTIIPVDGFVKSVSISLPKGSSISALTAHSVLVFASPSIVYQISHSVKNYIKNFDPLESRIFTYSTLSPETVYRVVGKRNVVYDKRTKKYLITLPKSVIFKKARQLMEMDSPPKNYQLNMLIASVSSADINNVGLSFLFTSGGLSFDSLTGALAFKSVSSGVDAINAVATLLSTKSNSKIVNRPFLQIRQNQPATFQRGQEVPFLISKINQSTGQIIQTVERKNVGLSLTANLTASGNGLQLKIDEKLSSISPTKVSRTNDIITDSQSLSTTLQVKPNYLYSLGGTSDTKNNKTGAGLYFFPLSKSETSESREIVIFLILTPINSGDSLDDDFSPWWD